MIKEDRVGINYSSFRAPLLTTLVVLMAWSLVWKGIALWKCGRNNQLAWFVVILIFNTLGILPIAYLLLFQKKAGVQKRKVKTVAKKKRK